ncbi:hypothetical protein QJS04_geneDACA000810 [Acorus gramineus]|uniref:SURP motif domain-containing protein n=1 Tax=Acorus gramineus TaxID=55184 RepID=A0AAV9BG57_ACOGR|nr:hypothetical protein QJS04_geneDACA000810 [Acorus gramineus]
MEVVGRHALLFDDDAAATFVNSADALVEWHSLFIDRYDVRHLLLEPPPPTSLRRKQRQRSPLLESDGVSRSELDLERYLDLPPPEADEGRSASIKDEKEGQHQGATGTYQAVGFSYGNMDASDVLKNSNDGLRHPGFYPQFPVPESLLNDLPPTEKVHQIISRTALFVYEHGGQSEIVLRVKQGDNPTFGFLMPDHQLHAYFRFLVDHPDLLKAHPGPTNFQEKEKSDNERNHDKVAGGALSLLGTVYGSGEDEDGLQQVIPGAEDTEPDKSVRSVDSIIRYKPVEEGSSVQLVVEGKSIAKHPAHVTPPSTQSPSVVSEASGSKCGKKTEAETDPSHASMDKKQSFPANTSSIEVPIVEPPSLLKHSIDKAVEFIHKNGKEFEAILIAQDRTIKRFPFLLPSNLYHSYYLKVLQEAKESELSGKNIADLKHESQGHVSKDRTKGSQARSPGACEGSYDPDKKERFKMIIGGPKKDAQAQPPKAVQKSGRNVDEAIKGTRVSQSFFATGETSNTASIGSISSLKGHSSISKPASNSEPGILSAKSSDTIRQPDKGGLIGDLSVAKAIAKTAAIAAASEADSLEASLTKEQKLKVERLKRAKMFAAMIKSGNLRSTESLETSLKLTVAFSEAETSDRLEKNQKNDSTKEVKHRSRKRHSSSSRKEHMEDLDDNDNDDDDDDDEKSHKRKRSELSSHPSREEHKHRKSHSKHRHRHHHSSSDDEYHHDKRLDRHQRSSSSHIVRRVEEADEKLLGGSHEMKEAVASDVHGGSVQSGDHSRMSDAIEVSDDLRAKVRAMLLATMQ